MAHSIQPRTYQAMFDYLFYPRSIAVVGASHIHGKIGYVLMRGVKDFRGKIFPVNPKAAETLGIPSYPSIREIAEEIDVALIVVPHQAVKTVVQECAEKQVKFAVLITSGFAEVGLRHEEEEILQIARKSGMRLLGPNCVGFGNTWMQLNASFLQFPEQGKLAFLSQSGGNGELLFSEALQGHLGFSKFASIGNAIDLHFDELIKYLVTDDETEAILIYLETVRDGQKFIEALQYAAGKKPVLVLKGGVSLSGMRATMSHTGSLSTYGELYKALFKQFGVLQVTTLQEMIDVGNVLRLPRMQGKNIVVMTNSGGTAIISVDLLEREGFIVPALPEETRKQLSTFLPEIASKQNPLDLTVEGSKEAFANSLDVIYHTAKPDAFFFPYSSPDYHPVERLETLVDHIVQRVNLLNLDIPFVTCSLPSTAFFVKRRFESHGFPSFITESRGAYALKMLYQYSTQNLYPQPPLADIGRESLLPILTKAIQAKCGLLLDEDECRIILHRVGFRIPQYARCANLDECLAAAAHLKYPLVMKVSAPTISHKSDIGGIITGIASAQELERAFTTIMSNVKQYHPREEIAGVFLSEQISKGHELLLGIKRDPIFGSFIMLGLGGIFVEIFKDVALRLAPISAEEARSMIDELKAAPLLYGVRGQPGIDLDNLIVNLVNLSQLAAQCPEIQELDINPLIALPQGQGCHVADVRIVVGL